VTFVHGLCAATTVTSLILPSGAAAAALGEPAVIPLPGSYCRCAAVEPLPIPQHMSLAHEPERAELNHIETTVDAFDLSNASPVVTGAGASQVPPDVWHPYVQSFESYGSALRQQGRAHEAAAFGLEQLARAGGNLRSVWQVRDHVASEKGTEPAAVPHAPAARLLVREQRCEVLGAAVTIVSSAALGRTIPL
jgi:hypothetical protein